MTNAASIKPPPGIVIASRESALAMWQARNIEQRLAALCPQTTVMIRGMTTQGDRILDRALDKIGGKGLFVKELEEALAMGSADIAVHSMKDVPMVLPPGFEIAAITEREDPRDAFVSNRYASLAALPAGSRIGTSSLRRESQLRARFPQLAVEPLRGNLQTRLKKLDDGNYAAIILAAAGLKRLGLADRITAILTPDESLPAPGQGALGIECRAERADVIAMMRALNHDPTAACVRAERALGRALSGSCQLPLGGYAQAEGSQVRLRGLVASQDGTQVVRAELIGDARDPETLGAELAARLKAQGAAEILAALEKQ
ncbi:MAG: hydroxymethylbilane synthase [Betaproteobacteria bacterium]|nr:hydroxymethylbilane synthase [Betaproteobacteria bacterium]